MYIWQNRVKQRLGSLEGSLGEFGQMYAQFKVSPGYSVKQDPNSIDKGYYLVNSSGQQASVKYDLSQIKSGGAKDYQGVVRLTWAGSTTVAPATTTSVTPKTTTTTDGGSKPVAISAPVSTGPSAGEVLTGVGSILAALAPATAGAFQTYTEASAAKAALKRERQQQQQQPMYGPTQPQVIQSGPSTGVILGIAGGFAAIALILILVLKK